MHIVTGNDLGQHGHGLQSNECTRDLAHKYLSDLVQISNIDIDLVLSHTQVSDADSYARLGDD